MSTTRFRLLLCLQNGHLGDIDENFIFEFGENTDVYGGCGAVFMGQMMYFGGVVCILHNISISLKFLFSNIHTAKSKNAN